MKQSLYYEISFVGTLIFVNFMDKLDCITYSNQGVKAKRVQVLMNKEAERTLLYSPIEMSTNI